MLEDKVHVAVEWVPPTSAEVCRVAAGCGSAAGMDGRRGKEIARLPLKFSDLFTRLTDRWLASGHLPKMFLQARNIYLPKDNKIQEDFSISPGSSAAYHGPFKILESLARGLVG